MVSKLSPMIAGSRFAKALNVDVKPGPR